MNIRERVLNVFHQNRKNPNEVFVENYFLTYLIPNPSQNHNLKFLHDSFKGNNRHNNFLNDIQIEFGICFSFKDKDKNYKLDEFIERVNNLIINKKASRAALNYRLKHIFHSGRFITQNIVILLFTSFLWTINITTKIIAVLIFLAFNVGAIYFYQRNCLNLSKRFPKVFEFCGANHKLQNEWES